MDDLERIRKTKTKPISEILIDIPQVSTVKERINDAIRSMNVSNELEIRIIYGDFGHGKSQTANLIVEFFRSNKKSNQIVYIENISTFRDFVTNLAFHLSKEIREKNIHFYDKIDYLLGLLNKANDVKISLSKIRSSFIKLIKELSERDYHVLLFLDELNKVIRDPIEVQNWIDFFITMTDESNLAILVACFIPQSTKRELINIDKRMERWNTFFNIKAAYLDGKYGNKIMKGIGNILALSAINHYTSFSDKSLEFIYNVFLFRQDYLEGASIRKINTWTVNLSEFIIECSKFDIFEKSKKFLKIDRTDKGLYIEKKLRILLELDQLPQFELIRKDSEERERYRVEYHDKNIKVGNKVSDGHYQQFVQFMNDEKLKLKVAVEVKYTEHKNHQDSQIEKVIKLADQYPTIFFSLGPEKSVGNELKKSLTQIYEKNIQKLPIFIINIPNEILFPLLLLPEDKSSPGFNQIKHILIVWSDIVTAHREELEYFFREIQSKLIQRKILLRSLELAGLPFNHKHTEKSIESKDTILRKAKKLLSASLVAQMEDVKSYKYLSTINSQLIEMINDRFPEVATMVVRKVSTLLDLLERERFIKKGGKKKTTINKEDKWNASDVMLFLEKNFVQNDLDD
ncbi:MAG: hypothetical protein GF311_06435 [Candidatus Lokiarchaeota archaeon]|nr:hypothetical protein [Candidatus Lokiarchaeota archaeon]